MDETLAATQVDLFWRPDSVSLLKRVDVVAIRDGSERYLYNQVLRTSARPEALPGLIEEIERWHTGVSRWLVVPPFQGALLERHLPRFGYSPSFLADAWVMDASAHFAEADVEVVEVHDLKTLNDNLVADALGFGRPIGGWDHARELALCKGSERRTARFVAYLDGEPVAAGNINRYLPLGVGLLWGGCVVPHARGKGIYRALLGARCRWAVAHGLTKVGLYANRETSGPVVAGLGFHKHGPMAYWERD